MQRANINDLAILYVATIQAVTTDSELARELRWQLDETPQCEVWAVRYLIDRTEARAQALRRGLVWLRQHAVTVDDPQIGRCIDAGLNEAFSRAIVGIFAPQCGECGAQLERVTFGGRAPIDHWPHELLCPSCDAEHFGELMSGHGSMRVFALLTPDGEAS